MKLNTVLTLATVYMLSFVLSVYTLGEHFITGTLFILSPLMMIWLVIRVLKDNYIETKTFEGYFYADENIERVKLKN